MAPRRLGSYVGVSTVAVSLVSRAARFAAARGLAFKGHRIDRKRCLHSLPSRSDFQRRLWGILPSTRIKEAPHSASIPRKVSSGGPKEPGYSALLNERRFKSKREDAQKRNFDGERFLDVSAKVIAHFFQTPNATENF